MLFDSHTHINSEMYSDEERAQVIAAIENSDVKTVVDIGCDLATSQMATEHAKKYPWCYAAVGFHPHETRHMDEMTLMMIKSLAKKEKVVAIGEIGLDFHYDHSPRDVQEYWFREQIKLANELRLPIVIHSREADNRTLEILKEEGAFSDERKGYFSPKPDGSSDARVLLHCYSGRPELAEQYVRLGATLSIAGPVTYKNNKKTPKVVEKIGIENLLIETDAPYLTPEPLRGRRNMSPYVEHTARRIALIKGMDYEQVVEQTCKNAERFFNIEES